MKEFGKMKMELQSSSPQSGINFLTGSCTSASKNCTSKDLCYRTDPHWEKSTYESPNLIIFRRFDRELHPRRRAMITSTLKPTSGADDGMKEDPGAGDGASPTQAASAEDGAAYHSTVREEPTSVCGMICDVWPLLLCQGLDATLGVCWTVVLYSSIRST